jgi:hypothetical protein
MGSTSLGEQFGQTLCPKRLQFVGGDLLSMCHGSFKCRWDCFCRRRVTLNRTMHCHSWPLSAMLIPDMRRTHFSPASLADMEKPAKPLT